MEAVDADTYAEAVATHARYLGMDPEVDGDLLWLAAEALTAELPPGWETVTGDNDTVYYFNPATQESRWDHPMDEAYRSRYLELRQARAERGRDVSSHGAAEKVSPFKAVVLPPSPDSQARGASAAAAQQRSPSRGSQGKPLTRSPVTSPIPEVVDDDFDDDDEEVEAAMRAAMSSSSSKRAGAAPASTSRLAPLSMSALQSSSRVAAAPAAALVAVAEPARRALDLAMSLVRDDDTQPNAAAAAGGDQPRTRASSVGTGDTTHGSTWDDDDDSTMAEVMTGSAASKAPAAQARTIRGGMKTGDSQRDVTASADVSPVRNEVRPMLSFDSPKSRSAPASPAAPSAASRLQGSSTAGSASARRIQASSSSSSDPEVASTLSPSRSRTQLRSTGSTTAMPRVKSFTSAVAAATASPRVPPSRVGSFATPRTAVTQDDGAATLQRVGSTASVFGSPSGAGGAQALRSARSPGDDLALQRRIDGAISSVKTEMESELQRTKSQYANMGARQAAELARTQTERDEWAARATRTGAEAEALRAKVHGMEAAMADHARRLSEAQSERDAARVELVRVNAALASSAQMSAADAEALRAETATLRSALDRETAAHASTKRVAETDAASAVAVAESLRGEKNALAAQVRHTEELLATARADAAALSSRASDVGSVVQSLREGRDKLEAELHDARGARQALEASLADATHRLTSATSEVSGLQARVAELSASRDEVASGSVTARVTADATIADLERTLRDLRTQVTDMRAQHEVALADVTAAHERALAAARLEAAQEVSRLRSDADKRITALQQSHQDAQMARASAHAEELRALQTKVFDAETRARSAAEEGVALASSRAAQDESAYAAKVAEIEAAAEIKLRRVTEAATNEKVALDAERREALARAAEVEASAKLRAAELAGLLDTRTRRVEELERHATSLSETLETERLRAVRAQADADATLRRSLDEQAAEHRTVLASVHSAATAEMSKLRTALAEAQEAVRKEAEAAAQAVEARAAADRVCADAEARVKRLTEALRATQNDLQAARASTAVATADARFVELEAALAAKELVIQRMGEELQRAQAGVRAAREAAAAEVDDMRSHVRNTVDREVAAACEHASAVTAAEWKARLAVQVADMAMEKESATRRAHLLGEEVERLSSALSTRVREMEITHDTRVSTLREEMDRVTASNAMLISLLKDARSEAGAAAAQSESLSVQLRGATAAVEHAENEAQSIAAASARVLTSPARGGTETTAVEARLIDTWRRRGVPMGDAAADVEVLRRRARSADATFRSPARSQGEAGTDAGVRASSSTGDAGVADTLAVLAAEVRALRASVASPAVPSAAAAPSAAQAASWQHAAENVINMLADAAAARVSSSGPRATGPPVSTQQEVPTVSASFMYTSTNVHDATARAAQSDDASSLGLARRLELSSTTQAVLQALGLQASSAGGARPGGTAASSASTSMLLEPLPDLSTLQSRAYTPGGAYVPTYTPSANTRSRTSAVMAALSAPSPSASYAHVNTTAAAALPAAGSASGWAASRNSRDTPSANSSIWYQPGYWRDKYGGGAGLGTAALAR